MTKKIVPIALAILAILTLTAFIQADGTGAANSQPRTVSVSGSGTAYLTPDIAYINIGVHTENSDAKEALATNNTQSQNVSTVLQKAGVAASDIQTTNFSIYPIQKYGPDGQVTETVYSVDNVVYITVRDLSRMGDILSTVVNQGANSINGIQFDVSDRSQAASDARKAAVADAHAQAEQLASLAGATLGAVQSVSVNESEPVRVLYNAAAKAAESASGSSTTPVSSGQMSITVDVSITYALQ